MSKDSNRLSRLGVLAPAALAACMDASMLAVPAAGAIVSTVLKELSKAFMLKKWFHGIMSAKEAEHLIMDKGKNGSFLVRESQAHPGEYVLSVRVRGRVSHVMIHRRDDKYDVGSGEQFDDLVGLIEHFRSYPMIETSGDVLRLLQPVSGTCVRARDIDRKVHDMEKTDDPQRFVKNGFDGEFQSLWLLEERQAFTTLEGQKLENATKNRYRNVLPYDHTRVVLRRRDHCLGSGDSDYINASHIRPSSLRDCFSSSSNESLNSVHSLRLYSEPKRAKSSARLVSKSLSDEALEEIARCVKLDKMNGNVFQDVVKDKSYIATQGCLQSTRADFWQMVWQEDVRIIAMIANEIEKGKKKCDRYWPSSGGEEKFDALTVRSVSETFSEDYLIRELEVCDQKTCRTVYQYQFTAWPDHGTPPEPDGVLAYLDDINRMMYQISQSRHAPQQNIICVHCSAGVGRTGTFIVLDMLIDQIKSSGYSCDIDVYNTVKLVRSCRKGMVQNRAQYKFIYLALQQYIDNKNLKLRKKVYTSDA